MQQVGHRRPSPFGTHTHCTHTHNTRCVRPRSWQCSFLGVKTDKIPPSKTRTRSQSFITLRVTPTDHARGPARTDLSGYYGPGSSSLLRITRPTRTLGFLPGLPTGSRFSSLPSRARDPTSRFLVKAPRTYEPHPEPRLSRLRLRTPAWLALPGVHGAAG